MFGLKIVPIVDKLDGNRRLTEEELDVLDQGIGKVMDWLIQVVHWVATLRAVDTVEQKQEERLLVADLWPQYSRLNYYWTAYYGRYYLNLEMEDSDLFERFNPKDWQSLCIISNRGFPKPEFLAYYAQKLENVVKHFLPGINQKNGLRICEIPAHTFERSDLPNYAPLARICYRIGNRWICGDCIETYNLGEQVTPPLPAKRQSHFKTEWEKMKPKRRLEILERDNFTCRKCQRSPLKEYGVKLKVVHIVAVMEGGKTKPDNLQTLCTNCLEGETGE